MKITKMIKVISILSIVVKNYLHNDIQMSVLLHFCEMYSEGEDDFLHLFLEKFSY